MDSPANGLDAKLKVAIQSSILGLSGATEDVTDSLGVTT